MIFRRLGLVSRLQHLNIQLTSHWVLNTIPNQHCLEEELSKFFISDFLQPSVFIQYRHFKNFSLLTLRLNLHTLFHTSNNLFQLTWIIIYFYLTLQCPAFVATLTCHPPISLMLLTNFILFPNPQMLFLRHHFTVLSALLGQAHPA